MNTSPSKKLSANARAGAAIRSGKIARQPCARCGSDRAVAHHDDYSKPLDVTWLCRTHHAERHPLEKFSYVPFPRSPISIV